MNPNMVKPNITNSIDHNHMTIYDVLNDTKMLKNILINVDYIQGERTLIGQKHSTFRI